MTAPRTASRRTRRSPRTTAAVALLLVAVAVGVVALLVASVTVLVVSLVVVLLASVAAARLLSDDLAQVRRDWARDRATLAHEHRRTATVRSHEQVEFATSMSARLREREELVVDLTGRLGDAEVALAEAEAGLVAAAAREARAGDRLVRAEEDLDAMRAEVRHLSDELAVSRGAELEARTALLAWQDVDESRRLA